MNKKKQTKVFQIFAKRNSQTQKKFLKQHKNLKKKVKEIKEKVFQFQQFELKCRTITIEKK